MPRRRSVAAVNCDDPPMNAYDRIPIPPNCHAAAPLAPPRENDIDLSVVIPVYNERTTIRGVLTELLATLAGLGIRYEIIVVDDGSTDESSKELSKLAENSITVLRSAERTGSGSARRKGMLRARGQWVAWIDGDGTYAPGDLAKLWHLRRNNIQLIGARPGETGLRRFPRRIVKHGFRRLAGLLWGRRIDDLNSGLRLIPRAQSALCAAALPQGFSCASVATMVCLSRSLDFEFTSVRYAPRSAGSASKFHPICDSLRLLGQILYWRILTPAPKLKRKPSVSVWLRDRRSPPSC